MRSKTILCRILWIFGVMLLAAPPVFSAPVTVSDYLENMSISGDLRIRFDYLKRDLPDEDERERLQQRFRIGMAWDNPSEKWTIAAGLATGGLDANSTNATYSQDTIFETDDIRLDYAFAAHKLNDRFSFLAGQQKNPYATTWALWDSDVRPVGFTAMADVKPVFITAGWYDVRYIDNDIAWMEAVQAGLKLDWVITALAFYNYHRVDEFVLTENMDPDFKYQIIDFYVESEIKMDPVKLIPRAQVFYNVGAKGGPGQSIQDENLDPEDENLGWLAGIAASMGRFKAGVDYAYIEADSVIPILTDSTFGSALGSTDVKGWVLGVGFKLTKNSELNATAFLYEAIERSLDQSPENYQLDLAYKF